ncbi:helix-turn-helix domain-containing protein, partial [Lactobacillus delbrueckii subsp. bulgaricus]
MTEQIEEVPAELIQTRVYELRPNETMRRVLDEACDYRRYCWNQGLALWNEMYKARQALKSSLASDSKKLTEEQKVLLKEKPLSDEFGTVSYFKEKGRYYVAIPYKIKAEDVKLPDKTGKATAVDVNVGHFDYTGGRVNVLPKKLDRIYKKIKHYQRQLAKKQVENGEVACKSENYLKTKAKLQACYRKASNIQNDLIHK